MTMATDLQGLGVAPLIALRTSTGGNGPLTCSAVGNTFATATKLQAAQFVTSVLNSTASAALALPTVGETGALLADDYVINNASTTSVNIIASTGVAISVGASNTNNTVIAQHTTMTLYPISTTQWIGVKGS